MLIGWCMYVWGWPASWIVDENFVREHSLPPVVYPWMDIVSTGDGYHCCLETNSRFWVTVGYGPELLAYWLSRLKAMAFNWAGHPANMGLALACFNPCWLKAPLRGWVYNFHAVWVKIISWFCCGFNNLYICRSWIENYFKNLATLVAAPFIDRILYQVILTS